MVSFQILRGSLQMYNICNILEHFRLPFIRYVNVLPGQEYPYRKCVCMVLNIYEAVKIYRNFQDFQTYQVCWLQELSRLWRGFKKKYVRNNSNVFSYTHFLWIFGSGKFTVRHV